MKPTLTRIYDNFTGWFLLLIFLAGTAAGALLAFDPAAWPEEAAPAAEPTSDAPPPTQASISLDVPTPAPGPTALPEFGTVISPFSVRIFDDPAGFSSPPLLDPSGGLYIVSDAGTLYALDLSGAPLWQVDLPASPAGSLLRTAAGEIVSADRTGRLAAYSPEGDLVWEFQPGEEARAVSGAAAAPDGNLLYMLDIGGTGQLQAVHPDGTPAWRSPVAGSAYSVTPWIYPAGSLVFVKSEAFDLQTGAPVPIELPFEIAAWHTAADGSAFLQQGPTIAAWTIVDGAVTLPEDGLRYVIPDPGANIRAARIDPAGQSWIAYIGQTDDGIAWFNPDGGLVHQVSTSAILLAEVVAADSEGTVYACGPSPREAPAEQLNQRTTYCLAFAPGSADPLWKERLAVSAQFFAGSAQFGAETFIATEEGDLVVLGRAEEAAGETPPAEGASGTTAIPGGWTWQSPALVLTWPHVYADGSLALLLETGDVYFFTAEGEQAGRLTLPEFRQVEDAFAQPVEFFDGQIVVAVLEDRAYAMQSGAGLLWEFPVEIVPDTPYLQQYRSGDVQFLLDTSRTLYAYTPQDGLLWQFPLEEGLRDDFAGPAIGAEGSLYIADSSGTLYAFDASGLRWSFDPGGNLRTASDPALGPDGNLYYVLTSGTSGSLASVTPDGALRWLTELQTFRFYSTPQFAAGGAYARVTDDFVSTETGVYQPVVFPFDVAEFIEGADGFDYVLTGSHVIRWQIGPEGFEQVRDTTLNLHNTNSFARPMVRVYSTGVIEIQEFTTNSTMVSWIHPETGEVRSFERPWSEIAFQSQTDSPERLYCEQDLEQALLTCTKLVLESPDPVWSLELQGIEGSVAGFPPPIRYADGRLYMVAGGRTVFVIAMEIP